MRKRIRCLSLLFLLWNGLGAAVPASAEEVSLGPIKADWPPSVSPDPSDYDPTNKNSMVREKMRQFEENMRAVWEAPERALARSAFYAFRNHVFQKNRGAKYRTIGPGEYHYDLLNPFFTGEVDLRKIKLFFGAYVPGDNAAITFGDKIFFDRAWDPRDLDLTSLMAHELGHVLQYKRMDTNGFAERYIREVGIGVAKAILRGEFDVASIHDAMGLEIDAERWSKSFESYIRNGFSVVNETPITVNFKTLIGPETGKLAIERHSLAPGQWKYWTWSHFAEPFYPMVSWDADAATDGVQEHRMKLGSDVIKAYTKDRALPFARWARRYAFRLNGTRLHLVHRDLQRAVQIHNATSGDISFSVRLTKYDTFTKLKFKAGELYRLSRSFSTLHPVQVDVRFDNSYAAGIQLREQRLSTGAWWGSPQPATPEDAGTHWYFRRVGERLDLVEGRSPDAGGAGVTAGPGSPGPPPLVAPTPPQAAKAGSAPTRDASTGLLWRLHADGRVERSLMPGGGARTWTQVAQMKGLVSILPHQTVLYGITSKGEVWKLPPPPLGSGGLLGRITGREAPGWSKLEFPGGRAKELRIHGVRLRAEGENGVWQLRLGGGGWNRVK